MVTLAPRLRVLNLAVLATLVVAGPQRAAAAGAPAYIGNGYVGTRVPADGAGYADAPVATETHVAGMYADKPDVDHGGIQLQGSVNLPGWTQLDVIVAATATPPPPRPTTARCWTCATAWSPRPRPGRRVGG